MRNSIELIKGIKPTKSGEISKAIKLPYNGSIVSDKMLSFSFSCLDRKHELFNMGSADVSWFLSLLDCLKEAGSKAIAELKIKPYELHPVRWRSANASKPVDSEQIEYWQFRINKSKGRIVGTIIDNVFYIVWLDRNHNLTNSNGYGKAQKEQYPLSDYEIMRCNVEAQRIEIEKLKNEIINLTDDINNLLSQ